MPTAAFHSANYCTLPPVSHSSVLPVLWSVILELILGCIIKYVPVLKWITCMLSVCIWAHSGEMYVV